MDSFDLALLQDWGLGDLCGHEQDKNILHRKEWERKTEEIHECEVDDFHSNYPLFSEPYKTSKGDELSSRIQSTLGNYDEMKDLLTDRSNQSHLVGIPKTDPSHIPVQKVEDNFPQYPQESCYPLPGTVQTGSITLTLPVQLTKQTTMNWQNLGLSPEDHEMMSTVDQRIDSSTSDFTSSHQNHIKDKNRNFSISPPSTTSSIDDPQQNMLSSTENSLPNKQMSHSKLNCDLEIGILVKDNACNKISTGVHTMQNFPGSVVSKLNVVQQKPTAYVRPMDGQDQVPSESPKLKSSIIINRGLSIKSDGDRMQRDTFVDPNLEEDNEHTGVGFFSSTPLICTYKMVQQENAKAGSADAPVTTVLRRVT